MENQETPKRKYKKHKEGFKIAVEYKVNTALKSYSKYKDSDLYPIYIEVRALGQRSFIKSRISAFIRPEDLDDFISNEITKRIIENEIASISDHLMSFYLQVKEEFSLKKWLEDYQAKIMSQERFDFFFTRYCMENIGKSIDDINVILAIMSLIEGQDTIKKTLSLAIILNQFQVPGIKKLIEEIRAYERINELLSGYDEQWLSPDIAGVLIAQHSLTADELLFSNILDEKMKVLLQNNIKQYLSDTQILRICLTEDRERNKNSNITIR